MVYLIEKPNSQTLNILQTLQSHPPLLLSEVEVLKR